MGLFKKTVDKMTKENKPFKFDNVLNGSGNVRSTMEAIFAHTTEFYACKIDNVKHLIWVPSIPHEIGKIVNYDLIRNDIAKKGNGEQGWGLQKWDIYDPWYNTLKNLPMFWMFYFFINYFFLKIYLFDHFILEYGQKI